MYGFVLERCVHNLFIVPSAHDLSLFQSPSLFLWHPLLSSLSFQQYLSHKCNQECLDYWKTCNGQNMASGLTCDRSKTQCISIYMLVSYCNENKGNRSNGHSYNAWLLMQIFLSLTSRLSVNLKSGGKIFLHTFSFSCCHSHVIISSSLPTSCDSRLKVLNDRSKRSAYLLQRKSLLWTKRLLLTCSMMNNWKMKEWKIFLRWEIHSLR